MTPKIFTKLNSKWPKIQIFFKTHICSSQKSFKFYIVNNFLYTKIHFRFIKKKEEQLPVVGGLYVCSALLGASSSSSLCLAPHPPTVGTLLLAYWSLGSHICPLAVRQRHYKQSPRRGLTLQQIFMPSQDNRFEKHLTFQKANIRFLHLVSLAL